jgi:hypothetical protein
MARFMIVVARCKLSPARFMIEIGGCQIVTARFIIAVARCKMSRARLMIEIGRFQLPGARIMVAVARCKISIPGGHLSTVRLPVSFQVFRSASPETKNPAGIAKYRQGFKDMLKLKLMENLKGSNSP